jgi:hypothetical protein
MKRRGCNLFATLLLRVLPLLESFKPEERWTLVLVKVGLFDESEDRFELFLAPFQCRAMSSGFGKDDHPLPSGGICK